MRPRFAHNGERWPLDGKIYMSGYSVPVFLLDSGRRGRPESGHDTRKRRKVDLGFVSLREEFHWESSFYANDDERWVRVSLPTDGAGQQCKPSISDRLVSFFSSRFFSIPTAKNTTNFQSHTRSARN